MALFRANSSNSKPNPKNFSWAIANEHASKALARRDDFLAAITYVCLMTRISIRAKKAPSNLMTTSLWFLVLINPEKLSSLYPPCLLALCQKRKPKFIPATLTLMANLMIMWTPLLVTALISSWKVALQHLACAMLEWEKAWITLRLFWATFFSINKTDDCLKLKNFSKSPNHSFRTSVSLIFLLGK